ncbi:conjugal transfer protein TraF [Legionella geestiana]|uniref:Conjugal transfer protein TraF n=1 Tax=Legionella geestiana TaxID=45065 RepID=A0A0W0U7W5_9GAMM|nr:conjugative transfer signal peptidase TraF [Legionella geestiana]KTD04000.1 conjugal transfer protein TraF [Legionella geestiana]QBS12859.1 conjugative transfer signal peptidase TraF [Legionella geestiana]STX54656.1 Conjugal transfer protein traF precursor [Legionella geestiana]
MKQLSICMISLLVLAYLLIVMGFRINLTDSIPVGLYRVTQVGDLKNVYVIFCPDHRPAFRLGLDRNYIDPGLHCGGYGYLMKKVVAIPGDILSITDAGVFVNQARIPFSRPKLNDGLNRPLPQWHVTNYQLGKNELMTMTSQSEWSFDGRYYGLVHAGQIKGMLRPLWVIKNKEKNYDE